MLLNYFKTAFRNLMREKTGTLLNIGGLTLGITCSILLLLIIAFHSGFDRFHSNADRIYRVVHKGFSNGEVQFQSGVPSPLRDAFALEFPEAEEVMFASYRAGALIRIPQKNGDDKKFQEESGVVFTEPSFFRIFDRSILAGDPSQALDEPNEAVISSQLAQKYFGNTDVMGEIVRYGRDEYRISAVMENTPGNTDFPFELMLSYATIKDEQEKNGWYSIWSDEQFYFLLAEGEPIDKINARLSAFTRKYRNNEQDKSEFITLPLADMHFDTRFETFSYQTFPKLMLVILGVIAGILVLTACINFINLATADAVKRSREVGIRKTMGSSRAQLILQFLGETVLVTTIAVVLSVGLAQIALGFLNPFLDMELAMDLTNDWLLPGYLILITLLVSLGSGFYPAMVISSYRPAIALKNRMENKASGGYFVRSALVVFQFFISQFFIIGTIVLVRQTDLFLTKDMGFSTEAILVVPVPEGGEQDREKIALKRKTLKHEISGVAGVERVALSSAPPFSGETNKTPFRIEGDGTEYITQYKSVDEDYLKLFEIDLLAGANLNRSDTLNGLLVNESFMRLAGFSEPQDIIGKMVTLYQRDYPVTGVVGDFNTVSLQNKIEPTVLFSNARGFKTMAIKVKPGNITTVLDFVKARWNASYPDQLFEYVFVEENIRVYYEGQQKLTQLLAMFTGIAIIISCLGLFGLVSFMTNQKTKEIGIRKVLGASVESVLISFSWKYVRLVLVGFILASPLGYFAMQQFLNEFAYRISLGPAIFISAFSITLGIAVVTAGYKSLMTARTDPVKSLRYE